MNTQHLHTEEEAMKPDAQSQLDDSSLGRHRAGMRAIARHLYYHTVCANKVLLFSKNW